MQQQKASTRILGRRTAPVPPFLIYNRVPYGFTQDPGTGRVGVVPNAPKLLGGGLALSSRRLSRLSLLRTRAVTWFTRTTASPQREASVLSRALCANSSPARAAASVRSSSPRNAAAIESTMTRRTGGAPARRSSCSQSPERLRKAPPSSSAPCATLMKMASHGSTCAQGSAHGTTAVHTHAVLCMSGYGPGTS